MNKILEAVGFRLDELRGTYRIRFHADLDIGAIEVDANSDWSLKMLAFERLHELRCELDAQIHSAQMSLLKA